MFRWLAGGLLILIGVAVVTHGWWSGFEEAGAQRVLAAEVTAAHAIAVTPAPAVAGSVEATPATSGRATFGPAVPAAAAAATATTPAVPVLAPLGHWRPPGPIPQIYASLSVPAIGLAAYVVRGASLTDYYNLLAWGPAHLRGSAEPGSLGNAVIFGHVDEFGSPFRRLDQVKPGEAITLDQGGSHYVYDVQWVRLVPATDLGIVDSQPGARGLTLFTCGGPANSDRTAVYATLASANRAAPARRAG